jgi:hypothetical protein
MEGVSEPPHTSPTSISSPGGRVKHSVAWSQRCGGGAEESAAEAAKAKAVSGAAAPAAVSPPSRSSRPSALASRPSPMASLFLAARMGASTAALKRV